MNSLFNNLIKSFNGKNKDLGDPNLKQGEIFDFMQNKIMTQNIPKLHLMEQTTGNGLASIIEPMTGTGNNPITLKGGKPDELEKLHNLEELYEQLINKLTGLNKHIDEPSVYSNSAQGQDTSNKSDYYVTKKGAPCPTDYSILNDTTKCDAFFKNLQDNPSARNKGEQITTANKQLNIITQPPNDIDKYTKAELLRKPHGCIILDKPITTKFSCGPWERCPIEKQTCEDKDLFGWGWCQSAPGATFNTVNTDIKLDPDSSLVCVENVKDELFSQIDKVNTKINIITDRLVKQIEKTNMVHTKEDKSLNTHRADFSTSLNGLIHKKEELDLLLWDHNNMKGQLQEKRIEMNASYLEYITWFICAITIGGVAFSKLSR